MTRMILTEDNLSKRREEVLIKESNIVLDDIKKFVNDLKIADNAKFDELLIILHGRFSKIELNIIELKELENGAI